MTMQRKASLQRKKRKKKKAPKQQLLPPPPASTTIAPLEGVTGTGVLEICRTKWQHGEWQELAAIDDETIDRDPDRAKLSLLVAAANSHQGNVGRTRNLVQRSLAWGCDSRLVARVLISAAQNSLGRCAICLEEENVAQAHFHEAIRVVEPRADARLLGRTRQLRETAYLGLLPEAARLLGQDLREVRAEPADHRDRLTLIAGELAVLRHQLSLSGEHANGEVRLSSALEIEWPSLTFPEAEAKRVKEAYEAAEVILEYGSGGSTVLASRLVDKLVFSVESDEDWAQELQRKLDSGGLPSPAVVYHANIGPTGAWGRPIDNSSWQKFHRYPTAIWSEPFFRHPDLILIDGRFRPACFVTVCLRISQPVTVLFDDYFNRPAYHVVEKLAKPVRTIGRMAEFHLEPQEWPSWAHDLLMQLCTQATYSTQKPDYGSAG